MRYIQLKVVPIESNEGQAANKIDYKGQLLNLVSAYPDGALIEEMRRHTKLFRKVKSANPEGLLKLEDAEHEILVKKLKAVKWAFFAEEIVDFCDALENAPESEPIAAMDKNAATAAM